MIALLGAIAIHLARAQGPSEKTPPTCATQLVPAFELPFVIEPVDPATVARELADTVVAAGGGLGAFALVEAKIHPATANVGALLQRGKNFAPLLERNTIGEQTEQVQGELVELLRALNRARQASPRPAETEPAAPGWWSHFLPRSPREPAPTPTAPLDVAATALRVRWLHFALLRLDEEIQAHARQLEDLGRAIEPVRRETRATALALGLLSDRLRATPVRDELKFRVDSLGETVGQQLQLLAGLADLLDQRAQVFGLARDSIRRVLGVMLPMEAVMGPAPLDLSPLEPSLPQALGAPTETADPGQTVVKTRLDVESFVESLNGLRESASRNRAIAAYIRTYVADLNTDQILQLVGRLDGQPLQTRNDELLLEYVEARQAALTVAEVGQLACKTRFTSGQNAIVSRFSNLQLHRLSTRELKALGDWLVGDDWKLKHFELMGLNLPQGR